MEEKDPRLSVAGSDGAVEWACSPNALRPILARRVTRAIVLNLFFIKQEGLSHPTLTPHAAVCPTFDACIVFALLPDEDRARANIHAPLGIIKSPCNLFEDPESNRLLQTGKRADRQPEGQREQAHCVLVNESTYQNDQSVTDVANVKTRMSWTLVHWVGRTERGGEWFKGKRGDTIYRETLHYRKTEQGTDGR